MASISEEFSGDCFDFDRLSASGLGGLVLKREHKEAVSRSREDFSSLDPFQHHDVVFKRIARRISSTPAFSEILHLDFRSKCTCSFPPPKSPTEILKLLTTQRRHAHRTCGLCIRTCGLCRFLAVREEFFPPAHQT